MLKNFTVLYTTISFVEHIQLFSSSWSEPKLLEMNQKEKSNSCGGKDLIETLFK